MSVPVKLLADKHIYLLNRCLPKQVQLTQYNPDNGIPNDVGNYDALFIRTVSPIDESVLGSSPTNLRFIASATAGVDHVDLDLLRYRNIEFSHSAGCNARAVAEYVATSILLWTLANGRFHEELTVGIIGAGYTGGAVRHLLHRLNIPCHLYDPPKERIDPGFLGCSLDDLLECDVLTFHVPLTLQGDYPTLHWLDHEILKKYPFKLIINASRGGVIDEEALYRAFQDRTVDSYILDVWEHEPVFNDPLASHAFIATPHIAGYSQQSKWNATVMAVKALIEYYGMTPPDIQIPHAHTSSPEDLESRIKTSTLKEILEWIHPVRTYDSELRKMIGLPDGKKSAVFRQIRDLTPLRHEFRHISLPGRIHDQYSLLTKLGVAIDP